MATDPYSINTIGTSALDAVSGAALPIIWTALAIILLLFAWWFVQHRHKVRIRILTSNGHVPYDDKAREVLVDNAPFWKLRKRKDMFPAPPRETIESLGRDFLGKPKYYHETYWSEEHGYIPIQDTASRENILSIAQAEGGKAKDTFKPLTPTQRALFTSQLRKASNRKTKSLLDTITQFATPMILVMLFLMVLLFWEDLAKPAKDMASSAKSMQDANLEYARQNAEIAAQNARIVQVLAGELEARELDIRQRVPAEDIGT